ncbi:hypothetical protein MAR_007725 [Mya arenaria]|uniref:Uncharacterized protein n=1 Tax=Mya arenaria TaxID=6604 RepID=A0ABY7DX28_MYAAR|nr:hypothetical protein MAR_007725 [Mya arenaria]
MEQLFGPKFFIITEYPWRSSSNTFSSSQPRRSEFPDSPEGYHRENGHCKKRKSTRETDLRHTVASISHPTSASIRTNAVTDLNRIAITTVCIRREFRAAMATSKPDIMVS